MGHGKHSIPGRVNISNAEPSLERDYGVCQELLGRAAELGLVTHETENRQNEFLGVFHKVFNISYSFPCSLH